MTIYELRKVLEACWDIETAYHEDRRLWNKNNKSVGQCTVTALIVNDFFGGKIIRGYSRKHRLYHYWNEIDGVKIDLTFEQFHNSKPDIVFSDHICKSREELLKIKSVKTRYLLLKKRVDDYFLSQNS